jgi:hypothetical protein
MSVSSLYAYMVEVTIDAAAGVCRASLGSTSKYLRHYSNAQDPPLAVLKYRDWPAPQEIHDLDVGSSPPIFGS